MLLLLRPRLEYTLSLARKHELVDSVLDLAQAAQAEGEAAEGEGSSSGSGPSLPSHGPAPPAWFSPEYREVLRSANAIRADFKVRARSLETLSGVVSDLFVDYHALKGQDVKRRIGEVVAAVAALGQAGAEEKHWGQLLALFEEEDRGPGGGRGGMSGLPPLGGRR
jgi:hypothetical protein